MSDQGQRPADDEDEQLWAAWSEAEKVAENQEGGNDAPADVAAPEAFGTATDAEVDLWANAPPDLRAAHDQQVKALEAATTEHARRSIEGRIVAYTRRLQERNAAAAQPPAPAATEEAANHLEELAAEYPEIATPLQKEIAPLKEQLSQFAAIEQSRTQAADAQMDADLVANEQLLATRHPDWNAYLHDYGAAFGAWIVDQPLYLRQAFVTNQDAIIDPYSAIDALDAFKDFVAENTQPLEDGAHATAPTEQTRLNSRRAAQLAGSASPQSVGSRPTVSGIPQDGDEQAIWNSFRDIDPEERKYRNA